MAASAPASQRAPGQHERDRAGYLHLAGHSMGGTLAKLLMLRLLQSGERRADEMETHTYGSFPVFAASCGSSGRRVLELAGISASRMRNWVLDFDYVPRMMISSDPYFQFALRSKVCRRPRRLVRATDCATACATVCATVWPVRRSAARNTLVRGWSHGVSRGCGNLVAASAACVDSPLQRRVSYCCCRACTWHKALQLSPA